MMNTDLVLTRDAVDEAIEAVQNGDREMFSVIVAQFHIQLRAFLAAQIHDKFDADDLAQQTFIFAYQHISEFELGTNFMAWLKAIAYNQARDYHASERRTSNVKQKLRQEIAHKVDGAMGSQWLDPRLEMLEQCVQRLPQNQREFLQTVCGRRATIDELATELNRSSMAVRKHLSRVYDSLRVCVEEHVAENVVTEGTVQS